MATTTEERPLRADARRNRERVLSAAKVVFARDGMNAQMDDIARRAKVGVGTIYRHFPTKEALVGALFAERMAQIAQFVVDGLEDEDPFRGLTRSMWRGAELGETDRALSQLFAENLGPGNHEPEGLRAAAAELVARAQRTGQLRPDFRADDIPVLMCGLMHSMARLAPDPEQSGSWRRHLQIIVDGLRARPDLEPLPE